MENNACCSVDNHRYAREKIIHLKRIYIFTKYTGERN